MNRPRRREIAVKKTKSPPLPELLSGQVEGAFPGGIARRFDRRAK
jgi:hypothetical protein